MDGGGEYRTILFGQRHCFLREVLRGRQTADADAAGDGVKYGKPLGGFRCEVAACLFEDVDIRT